MTWRRSPAGARASRETAELLSPFALPNIIAGFPLGSTKPEAKAKPARRPDGRSKQAAESRRRNRPPKRKKKKR